MSSPDEINSRKKTKGKPSNRWGELKDNFHTCLTATAKNKLKEAAEDRDTSISDLIEEFARSL